MAKFTFKGRQRGGGEITGTRSADSARALAGALRQEDSLMVEAKEKKGFDLSKIELGGNPTPKDLAIFTLQFSVMIDSGLPLFQCLEILGSQQETPKFAEAVKTIQKDVDSTSSTQVIASIIGRPILSHASVEPSGSRSIDSPIAMKPTT
jgi:type IV pilus assembly protein PilC